MLYFEAPTDPATRLQPGDLIEACIERGAEGLLLDHGALPADFFDLSTGIAGELVRRITLYGIRTAIVVPDPTAHSGHFRDFAREANRSGQFRFFGSRREAVEWLSDG